LGGFLMVNLWWIRGESWLIDGPISGMKNMPRIADFFWVSGLGLVELH